jgi:DNA-binding transcriptional ArsR family regulator
MEENEVSANGDTWYVDKVTGEIYQRRSHVDISYLAPVDIHNIKSRDVYNRVVVERTNNKRYRLWVCPLLLDMVIERNVSIPALSILCLLGRKVGYNNMVYTTTKELCEDGRYSRQTVSTALSELREGGFIREPNSKLEGKDDRFILISPLYFFLGYYPYRDVLLRDWMLSK